MSIAPMTPHDVIIHTHLPFLQHTSYISRLSIVSIYALVASTTLYVFNNNNNKHAPPGHRHRLFIAAACIVVNFLLPTIFHPVDEVVTTALIGLNFMWLASAKIFGWAIGRGPLSLSQLNFLQFTTTVFLPITPVITGASGSRQQQPHSVAGNGVLASTGKTCTTGRSSNARQAETGLGFVGSVLDFASKLVLLALVVGVLQSERIEIPSRLLRELLYALGLYLFIALVMSCVGVFTISLLNLRVAPHFDKPFLSQSFTDFWSRRWNLNTGYTMRFLVYDPICEGTLTPAAFGGVTGGVPTNNKIKNGSNTPSSTTTVKSKVTLTFERRVAAVCASFIVSGLLHEVFIIYLRGRVSGYWLAFFSLQGPIIVLESLARRIARLYKIRVPNFVAVPLTIGALLLLGDAFFFYDINRMGIPAQVVGNIHATLVRGSLSLKN